jgi:hypothetical protein
MAGSTIRHMLRPWGGSGGLSARDLEAAWVGGELLARAAVGAAILSRKDQYQATRLRRQGLIRLLSVGRGSAALPTTKGMAALGILEGQALRPEPA